MQIYVLRENTETRPHGLYARVIAVSTNKVLIFEKATKLSRKAVDNRSSWKDKVYWVHVFDDKTGKELDEVEFDSNGRHERTFGKIVRNRGSRDEMVVGSWV